jgi:uncharacterized protein
MSQAPEVPVVIQGDLHTPMLGVLHRPAGGIPSSGTGVVIVNGGAQYRAGAHRLFVQLARHLAAQGHAVLRFDLPGQGDSPGDPVHFEETTPHIRAAVAELQRQRPHLHSTALMGLCDGASGILLFLHNTPHHDIPLVVLINPWVRTPESLAQVHLKHHYARQLTSPAFWKRLLRGDVRIGALPDLVATVWTRIHPARKKMTFVDRMASAWSAYPGGLLLITSEHDTTGQEFDEALRSAHRWARPASESRLCLQRISHADHTCSTPGTSEQLQQLVTTWLSDAGACKPRHGS